MKELDNILEELYDSKYNLQYIANLGFEGCSKLYKELFKLEHYIFSNSESEELLSSFYHYLPENWPIKKRIEAYAITRSITDIRLFESKLDEIIFCLKDSVVPGWNFLDHKYLKLLAVNYLIYFLAYSKKYSLQNNVNIYENIIVLKIIENLSHLSEITDIPSILKKLTPEFKIEDYLNKHYNEDAWTELI